MKEVEKAARMKWVNLRETKKCLLISRVKEMTKAKPAIVTKDSKSSEKDP